MIVYQVSQQLADIVKRMVNNEMNTDNKVQLARARSYTIIYIKKISQFTHNKIMILLSVMS
jgi:hypothetical protein